MDLHLTVEQKQALSQRMIQSARILQMTAQELKEYVEEQALENPVIDIKEHVPAKEETDDRIQKYEWLNASSYQQESQDPDDSSEEWRFPVNEGETLKDHLWSQLITGDFTEKDLDILDYMLESLDPRGYLTEDVKDIAKHFHEKTSHVAELLCTLQSLEPAGICARSLSECLILQAARHGVLTRKLEELLKHHLDQVAKNQLPLIAKELQIPVDAVSRCCQIIRDFDPKPGSSFYDREQTGYLVPDMTIVKFEDHFDILLNEYLYPDIRINSYYRRLSKEQQDPETTAYLTDKLRQAQWISDCIAKRSSTLLEVARKLLFFQQDFFTKGPACLKPLLSKDIAEALGIHESTVSRAVRGKYLQCTWGVYPLNFFFSRGIVSPAGTEEIAVNQVKTILKEIIAQENKKKPFSDRAISEELEKRGISISRRTAAKYRQELGIPDASGRKTYPEP